VSSGGSRVELGTLGHVGDRKTSEQITGTAVDQNGNPLPENTTIEAWGIREPALDAGDAQELQREANQLLDELDNATPSDFAPDLDPRDAVADAADTTYVAAPPGRRLGDGRARPNRLGVRHARCPVRR